MCGRYTLSMAMDRVAAAFGAQNVPEDRPRYNVAPRQIVAVVGLKADGTRSIAHLRWGLVPSWANDPNSGPRPINARAETLLERPMFRSLFKSKRCLIPSDGLYEWRKVGKAKQPFHIRLRGGGVFGFAGLWDVWGEGDGKIASCCIVTVEANEIVRPVHERMPAIIPPECYGDWLDPETPTDRLMSMLKPFPNEEMETVPVGQAVNSPANDGPECLIPAA
jgi:putative SOS response-associated peptidase YedK